MKQFEVLENSAADAARRQLPGDHGNPATLMALPDTDLAQIEQFGVRSTALEAIARFRICHEVARPARRKGA